MRFLINGCSEHRLKLYEVGKVFDVAEETLNALIRNPISLASSDYRPFKASDFGEALSDFYRRVDGLEVEMWRGGSASRRDMIMQRCYGFESEEEEDSTMDFIRAMCAGGLEKLIRNNMEILSSQEGIFSESHCALTEEERKKISCAATHTMNANEGAFSQNDYVSKRGINFNPFTTSGLIEAKRGGHFDNASGMWSDAHKEAAMRHVVGNAGRVAAENEEIMKKRRAAVDVKREKIVEDHARKELERQLGAVAYYHMPRVGELTERNVDEVLNIFKAGQRGVCEECVALVCCRIRT